MTMGAGMVMEQGPTLISKLIQSGEFFKSEAMQRLIGNCINEQVPLHLLGLLSDGNIHSHINHFEAIISGDGCATRMVFPTRAFSDSSVLSVGFNNTSRMINLPRPKRL